MSTSSTYRTSIISQIKIIGFRLNSNSYKRWPVYLGSTRISRKLNVVTLARAHRCQVAPMHQAIQGLVIAALWRRFSLKRFRRSTFWLRSRIDVNFWLRKVSYLLEIRSAVKFCKRRLLKKFNLRWRDSHPNSLKICWRSCLPLISSSIN